MDRTIRTKIVIDAPPERVWEALTDFGDYSAWNPCIRRIDGEASAREPLRINVRFGSLPPIRFLARIDRFRKNEILGWRATFLFGILEGRHWFELYPLDAGKTRFVHNETFTGPLATPFLALLSGVIRQSYDAMNRALQAKVEQK